MKLQKVMVFLLFFLYSLNIILVVNADTQVWENEYGRLEVYPMNATGLGRFTQWANLTWYYPDNTIDVAFRFNDSLKSGNIWYKPVDTWNQVSMQHTTYNGKHYYYYQGFNVKQDKTYNFKWSYVPKNLSGKWDLIAKLSSDSWATAYSSGRYIFLDPWWNSSWLGKVQLWVNASYIEEDLVNFPVLVNSTNTDIISSCQSNGEDIRFVDDSETTEYCYEIEDFTAGGMNVWVNISDTVDDTSNTSFWMYYGNAGASDNQSVDTWDSHYWVVLHMDDASGFLNDSTVNGTNFREAGGPLGYQATGKVGYAVDGDGSDDYFRNTTLDMTSWDEATFECWLKPDIDVGGNAEYIFSFETNTLDDDDIRLAYNRGATGVGDSGLTVFFDDGGAEGGSDYNHDYYDDHFRYYVGVCDGNAFVYGYENTTRQISDETVNFNFGGLSRDNHNIMRRFTGSKFNDGIVDEIRISDVARNWSWVNATYHSIATSDFIEWGSPIADIDQPTDFIAETFNITQINLTWTKNASATHTVIERNTASSWSRGSGTEIYNNTGTTFSASSLTSYTKWYFQAWSYNSTMNKFSAGSDSANNITGPTNPSNVVTDYQSMNGHLNISWTKSPYADTTMVRQKNASYPTDPSDGSNCYNGTLSWYNHSGVNTTDHFRLWSWNATVGLWSSGINAPFGSLIINVYNESDNSSISNYDVIVSSQDGSQVYQDTNASNTHVINVEDCPLGEDIVIYITEGNYSGRVYHMDLQAGNSYTLDAFLPYGDASELYRLQVIGPESSYGSDTPIENANVIVKRNINGTFEKVSSLLTNANGESDIYLIPQELYVLTINATYYINDSFTLIPRVIQYQGDWFYTFRLQYTSDTTISYDFFWDIVTFTGVMDGVQNQLGNITLTYVDSNSSTLNTQIRLFENYNNTATLLKSITNTSEQSFTYKNGSINTSRSHYAVLYFNSTADYDETSPVVIQIPAKFIYNEFTPFDFEARTRTQVGPAPLGQYLDWATLFVGISFLLLFGKVNAGLGVMMMGGSMGLMQGIFGWFVNNFNVLVIGLAPFLIFAGLLWYFATRDGGDNL